MRYKAKILQDCGLFKVSNYLHIICNRRLLYRCHSKITHYEVSTRSKYANQLLKILQKQPTICDRVVEFIIPMFLYCSTRFERHTAHHQDLKNSDCSLCFYIRFWWPADVMAKWELSSAMTATSNQKRM
jgi:hypothetical protein